MPPALATARGWSARSPGSACGLPPTPTAINEHAARLHEPSKSETPTQLACPLRSRYVWTGGSHSPRVPSPAARTKPTAGRASGLAGRPTDNSRQPQRRYSSFEAYVVDGEVLDGETGWTSPSGSHHLHRRNSANSNGSAGGGNGSRHGSGPHSSNSNGNASGAGSSLRPGGRSSFFFGADYATLGGTSHVNKRAEQAAAKLPSARVDPKAAAVLGVAGSASGVPSKAQKFLGVGRREGEEGRVEVLALQDVESLDVNSGAGSTSPRKEEAPPAFAPLGADEEPSAPGDESDASSMTRANRTDVDVQVAFPPDFEDTRKATSDSDDSGKARSGASLGTKSGSTSLLSMLSGSPRSLGTAHESASGSPSPRTPLSDHSSSDGVAGRAGSGRGVVAAAIAARNRNLTHEPWSSAVDSRRSRSSSSNPREDLPAVSVEGSHVDKNDGEDLPSAHPTSLHAFSGDSDLPSDHPTPLSTAENLKRVGTRTVPSKKSSDVSQSINPAAGSFMQRLKYWGGSSGGGAEKNSMSAPGGTTSRSRGSGSGSGSISSNPAAATRTVTMGKNASPNRCDERQSLSTAKQSASPVSSLGVGIKEEASSSPTTESVMSSSELGVKIVPFDSVTSDSISMFASNGSGQQWRAPAPPQQQSSSVQQQENSSTNAAARHRKADSRDDLAGFEPLVSASSEKVAAPTLAIPSPSVRGGAAQDTASMSASKRFSGFGAAHRAELAALRLARGTPAPGDEDIVTEEEEEEEEEEKDEETEEGEKESDEESEMNWEGNSDRDEQEDEEEKEDDEEKKEMEPEVVDAKAEELPAYTAPRARGRGVGPADFTLEGDEMAEQHQQLPPPPPPRYMAIVEEANVTGALDNSSTSEHDTCASEDDGGVMAEILTDRLMEVCSKMEAAAAPPATELSDGEGAGAGKRRPLSRRRQMSNMSSARTFNKEQGGASTRRHSYQSSFFSSSGILADGEAKDDIDSDEEDDGAVARKLRRERMRKRSRAQSRKNLSSALTIPSDSKGEPINIHTATYNGHLDLLTAYITQGGDLEARDQFQASALMLASERGHTEMVDALLTAGAETCGVDENGNSALHLACFYGNRDVVQLLLSVDVDVEAKDAEGRTPLDLATDQEIRRMVKTEEVVRMSGENFDLLGAVEVNDTTAVESFIIMGQEACGYPANPNALPVAAQRLRLDRHGRGGMSAVHLAAFHGYADCLRILLEGGADPNAVCDDGETPLHTACTGGSTLCATLLLDHGANPLATDAKGLVPCEKHIAGGRQEMKRLLEVKAFQATPANLMTLRNELSEVALQIDAEEELFVRKGVAIKYLRKALKKKEADTARLRQAVDARDTDIRNLRDRMDGVHQLLMGVSAIE